MHLSKKDDKWKPYCLKMMQKYESIWDGHLRKIIMAKHKIDLSPQMHRRYLQLSIAQAQKTRSQTGRSFLGGEGWLRAAGSIRIGLAHRICSREGWGPLFLR